MSWYSEDKKMREDLIGKVVTMCKRHGYELGEEDLKRLNRMKFAELGEFSSKLVTALSQRQHEVWEQQIKPKLDEANQKLEEKLEQWRESRRDGAGR